MSYSGEYFATAGTTKNVMDIDWSNREETAWDRSIELAVGEIHRLD